MPLLFSGERFELLPCGALYWPAQDMLLVADLHFEKASHYAARGWPLPPWDSDVTLTRLEFAVASTGVRRLVALGDSFHDRQGPTRLDMDVRARLQGLAASVDLLWLSGNHDGVNGAELGGDALESLEVAGIILRHEAQPEDMRPEISGHFHPRITIRQKGRTLRRRCIVQSPSKLVLPAYGSLAGGLDVDHPALAAAVPGRLEAVLNQSGRLLRFPVPT
jgi:DNA ligase-associated metallophosphoesterase